MAHGLTQYFTATIASGTSVTSTGFNLGRSFARVYVETTGATQSVHFQVAPNVLGAAGTYSVLKYGVASGMSAPQTVTVGTATSGSFVEVPMTGFQFIKVYAPGGAADGATIRLIASDL